MKKWFLLAAPALVLFALLTPYSLELWHSVKSTTKEYDPVFIENDANNKKLVVFIHGFTGDKIETWGELPELMDVSLNKDMVIQNYDVLFWGYPSSIFGENVPFYTAGRHLSTTIKNHFEKQYEDIIFIAHSVGGLVVRAFILDRIEEEKESELKSIRRILLFGTPSEGVTEAQFIPTWLNEQAGAVSRTSEFINKTKRPWSKWLKTYSEDETKIDYIAVIPIVGVQDKFVPESSVRATYQDPETVSGNHVTMVKIRSKRHDSFRLMRNNLASELNRPAKYPESVDTRKKNVKQKADQSGNYVDQCDKLASSINDRQRKFAGRKLNYIEPNLAEPPCQLAIRIDPNNPRLQFQYGRVLMKAGRETEAFNYVRRAASNGYVAAIELLGEMYRIGAGAPRNNARAIQWYKRAAELGNGRALNSLGMYAVIDKKYKEAIDYFKRAENEGFIPSRTNIATMYLRGDGVKKDIDHAINLLMSAADHNDPSAYYSLGKLHFEGKDVEQNIAKAIKFLSTSVDLHFDDAHHILAILHDKSWEDTPKNPKKSAQHFLLHFRSNNLRALSARPNFLIDKHDEISAETKIEIQRTLKNTNHYTGDLNGIFDLDFVASLSSYKASLTLSR